MEQLHVMPTIRTVQHSHFFIFVDGLRICEVCIPQKNGPIQYYQWELQYTLYMYMYMYCMASLLSPDSGVVVATLRGHEACVKSLSLHSSGRYVLAVSTRDSVLWDLDSFARVRTLSGGQEVGVQDVSESVSVVFVGLYPLALGFVTLYLQAHCTCTCKNGTVLLLCYIIIEHCSCIPSQFTSVASLLYVLQLSQFFPLYPYAGVLPAILKHNPLLFQG